MSELDIVRDQSALLVDWAEASADSVRANTAREGILVAAFALAARVETLTAELAEARHQCAFPSCVEGEKPPLCGHCGDSLRAEAAEALVVTLENALRNAASAAGHPDAAEGCRLVIAIYREALASRPAGEETRG